MKRKRLTQLMPFLVPIRIWQRNLFYQIGMIFDKNTYSKSRGEELPYKISSAKTIMINKDSGQDIIYQTNKVHNLKIVSKTMNKIYIYPNETFSFCYLLKYAKKYGKFRKGLVLIDNKLVSREGGGICHLSNLLYEVFLMSPLTIVERHGHRVKALKNPDKDSLDGIDATIISGWLDLKVRNDTKDVYQIIIDFDDKYMYASILSSNDAQVIYKIKNENLKYIRKNKKIFESISVIKEIKDKSTNQLISKEKLYDEIVEVKYNISEDIKIDDYNE